MKRKLSKTIVVDIVLISFTTLFIVACKPDIKYYDSDGISIEVIPESMIDSTMNKYTVDNKIFVPMVEYIYDYYLLKDEKKLKFSSGGWEYIEYHKPNNSTIVKVGIQTMQHTGFLKPPEDYTQSIIQFNYYDIEGNLPFGKTQTGVIENDKNVWIHPPRKDNFRILEINPFPFAKGPYKVGNEYKWQLKIGDQWADPNWKVWSGAIENNISYKITDKLTMDMDFGSVDVYEIKATAKSRIGETHLTSYFSKKYGFVKCHYTNIDSSELILELKELKQLD